MNEQQLQCFTCVAEHLNFTKAAKELFLTVSTVTHHIQSLEAELNTKLFIRTTRTVALTDSGNAFYPDAREILAWLEVSKQHIQKADTKHHAMFRIGCISYSEFPHLQPVLAQMRKTYPAIHPMVTVDSYYNLKKLFENKQLDLILLSQPMAEEIKGGIFRKVRTVKNFALIPPNLSRPDGELFTIGQSENDCLIIIHPRLVPFQNDNKLQRDIMLHIQNHDHIPCEDEQTAILLAQSGYGIAVLPDFLLPVHLDGLTALPIQEPTETEYGILCQRKDTCTRFFLDEYKKVCAKARTFAPELFVS